MTEFTVRTFTKTQPCTKLHLWQCFRRERGFARVPLPQAWSVIGKNAPKNMLTKGYVRVVGTNNGDAYQLTPAGRTWLTDGFRAYLRRHPEAADQVDYLPS